MFPLTFNIKCAIFYLRDIRTEYRQQSFPVSSKNSVRYLPTTTRFVPYQEQLRDRTEDAAATVRFFGKGATSCAVTFYYSNKGLTAEDEGVNILRPLKRAFFVEKIVLKGRK